MKFFDKIFKSNQASITPSEELGTEIFDLIFDWFKDAGKSVQEFEEKLYQPILEGLESNKRLSWYFENQKELALSSYYVILASYYLARHHPKESYLTKFLNYFSKEKSRFVKEDLNVNDFTEYVETEEQSNTIFIGCAILRAYRVTIYANFSHYNYTENIAKDIGHRAYIKEDLKFETVFRYVTNLKFNQKIHYILSVHSTVPSRFGRTEHYEEENQFEGLIKEAFEKAVTEHNSLNKLQLSSEILWDYHKAFYFISNSKLWDQTDYKKRKSLTTKDFPDTVAFIEKYKSKANEALKNLLFLFNLESINDYQTKIYKELLARLIKNASFDLVWIRDMIDMYDSWANYKLIINDFLIPIIAKHTSKIPFNDPLVKKFESLIFKEDYDFTPAKAISLMHKLCENIEDESIKSFEKLKYSETIANSYFFYPRHPLELKLESKSIMTKRINHIVDQLNLIVPTGLKAYKHPNWYPEDDEQEFLRLNINGEDISLPFDLVVGFNKYFIEHKMGYQFLPIPMLKGERDHGVEYEYYGMDYHVSTLAFVNQSQFKLLMEYVGQYFPDLLDAPAYKEADFSGIEAPSLYKLNKAETAKSKKSSDPSIENDGSWYWFKKEYLDELSSKEKWYKIIPVLSSYRGKKPNKTWLKNIEAAMDSIGKEQFFKELGVMIPPSLKEEFWFLNTYTNTLKGIITACTRFPTDISLGIVRDIILASYTKIPNIGPRSAAIGNFALKALTESGNDKAFGILNIIRNKTKYQRFIKVLDKHIEQFAEFSDTDPQLLADKSIPRLGFEGNSRVFTLEGYQHIVTIKDRKIKKSWIDDAGKSHKSIPGAIKENHPKKLKEVSEEVKQLSALFKDLKSRIKTYWRDNREWNGSDWKAYIFSHPLVYPWIEGMIWRNETKSQEFIVSDQLLLSVDCKSVEVDAEDIISLWHPVNSSPEIISSWQDYIISHKIIQAERQAFREHYPFSENEKTLTASPRFAHHFLEVRKLMAVANASGWIFTYVHEDVNWPRFYIKALDITAHLQCDYTRFDEYIPTKNFIITKGDTTKISYGTTIEGLAFRYVPEKTLSEICRDIDLFISTTSVANNPELSEKSEVLGTYRKDFLLGSFSENANSKLRKEILPGLLNKVGVTEFSFEGNFLVIEGGLNKYRINLGSGFAQVYGSQKHLTLLPDTSKIKRKFSLPLIEDETLNLIIAKAIFLQKDSEINDENILKIIK